MSTSTNTMVIFLLLLFSPTTMRPSQAAYTLLFSGENSFGYLEAQCVFGPRPPGSENLSLCRAFIASEMESFGWNVTLQSFTYRETECVNIIASWRPQNESFLLLGAHYDTRPRATEDPDPENQARPILGANDGASGVAVLMELAKILPLGNRSGIKIVFFDAEDSGQIDGWDWIQGSTYFVSQLNQTERSQISAMILLDMVGDTNLQLPREASSTDSLQDDVWSVANALGYNHIFLDRLSGPILDDHRPFLEAGIPALDIIQVESQGGFPWYWHTLEDTPDKCSSSSLEVVGRVLESFILGGFAVTYPLDPPILFYLGVVGISLVLGVYVIIHLRRR